MPNSKKNQLEQLYLGSGEGRAIDLLLGAADRLFYREGIRAVGVDRLCEEAGVAKASLYNNFKNKDEIVIAYLQSRHERVISSLTQPYETDAWTAKIAHVFDLLELKALAPEFRGCAFLLAVSEYPHVEKVISIAKEHKLALRNFFFSLMPLTIANRNELATQISALYDGALAGLTIHKDPKIVRTTRNAATILILNAVHNET